MRLMLIVLENGKKASVVFFIVWRRDLIMKGLQLNDRIFLLELFQLEEINAGGCVFSLERH